MRRGLLVAVISVAACAGPRPEPAAEPGYPTSAPAPAQAPPAQPLPNETVQPQGEPGPVPGRASSFDGDDEAALDTLESATAAFERDQQSLEQLLSGAAPLSTGDGCPRACRAIASMRRSVGAICRLAGDDDPRCRDAQAVLENNERRITGAGCTC